MNLLKITSLALLAVIITTDANAQLGQASLKKQVANLREEVLILQRQSYRDKGKGLNNTNNSIRMGEFDETLRQAIGKIDEIDHKIKKLNEKIDIINKDIDIRIKLIEGKTIESGKLNQAKAIKKFDAPIAKNAPKSITGASITKGSNLPQISSKDVNDIYQEGLSALKANNTDLAEENFKTIIANHPNDKLAGNAQYWLGEAYYGKKQFDKAAVTFAKGYQKYKSTPKGADSLLKLGMSMKELGKKDEACAAFLSLPTEFPKAPLPLKNKAAALASATDCK